MKQRIQDRRRLPFFQVTKADLSALADACAVDSVTVKLSSVRSVYFALLEIANDSRADTAEVTRKELGDRAGVSSRTVFDAVRVLQSAALLEIDQTEGHAHTWILVSADDTPAAIARHPGNGCQTPRQPLPDPIETNQEVEKKEPPTPPRGEVDRVWGRFVAMRQRSPKKLRRAELDSQTRRMVQKALEVGSEDEWLRAVDALLLSRHHVGQNDRRKVYLEPRHVFTACTHGTVRGHLDWLLDLAPQTAVGAGVSAFTSSDDAVKIRQAKLNVLRAFDLAGSDEARRKGDESERRLLEHGIRVVRRPGERPSFEEQDEPEQGRLLGDDS